MTDYRNPSLAEIMRDLGYVQRFGAGIPITVKSLSDNDNPPAQFEVNPSYVGVTIGSRM
jgi:ATP-dependent DNA helicase RecG